jgi:hypothetical protein
MEFDILNIQFAGFDLRKIKNVIDDSEKGVGTALNFFQIIFLFRRLFCLQSQMRHTDDCIHGSPNFMAHVGQKIALGLVGLIGNLFGFD